MQVIAGPIDQGEHMADTNPQLNLTPEQDRQPSQKLPKFAVLARKCSMP